MNRRPITRALTLATASAFTLLALASPASAATINVNTTNDENNGDADCSLREAVITANDNVPPASGCTPGTGPGDTINVPAGRYTLEIPGASEDDSQTGDLDIQEPVTIAGAGARGVIVDAGELDRVFHVLFVQNGDRVGPAGQLPDGERTVVSGLTMTGGSGGGGDGGGLRSESDLDLREVTIDGNRADEGGAAQLGNGNVRIVRSTLSDNVATNTHGGGAIHNNTNNLTIDTSTVSGNRTNGQGGAILEHGGVLTLVSSTIVKNLAEGGGGGIADAESEEVGPQGGPGPVPPDTARNTIIANNRFTSVAPTGDDFESGDNCVVGEPLASQGFNLENKDECGFDAASDQPNTPSGIGPLANNGGQTDTHRLNANSAAVDEGNAPGGVDQRRMMRPRDGDGNGSSIDDIGAFELQPAAPPPPPPPPPPECTITGTDDNDILRGTPGRDVICGRDGNDIIYGLEGDDILRGGGGNDVLRGGEGDDQLGGNEGNDLFVGGDGNDSIEGGPGDDELTGQAGDDDLDASDGVRENDVANGGSGSDSCSSDPGDERTSC